MNSKNIFERLYQFCSFFTIRNWTNLGKTYQINAILIGAATIQERPLMARVRYIGLYDPLASKIIFTGDSGRVAGAWDCTVVVDHNYWMVVLLGENHDRSFRPCFLGHKKCCWLSCHQHLELKSPIALTHVLNQSLACKFIKDPF